MKSRYQRSATVDTKEEGKDEMEAAIVEDDPNSYMSKRKKKKRTLALVCTFSFEFPLIFF